MTKMRLFDRHLNESLDHMFRRFMTRLRMERDIDFTDMRVDLLEQDGTYHIVADMPGIKKDDISVRVDGNIVQIDAGVQAEHDSSSHGGRLLRSERSCGHLSRMFTLPQDVDESKVTARYADGVLKLDLPKKSQSMETATSVKIE